MDRREFLKKTAALGFGAGLFFLPKGLRNMGGVVPLTAQEKGPQGFPDLVALKGGTPEAMFERGMAMIGGMGRFVKNGQTVVIKPNMSWDLAPEYASNTSPALLAAVIKQCKDAGARRVLIVDHSLDYWERAIKTNGILAAATGAGAVYANADKEGYYQRVSLGGKILKDTKIHEAFLESDVFISVPVLKHHGGSGGLTSSMKNLMGCVWDRNTYHRNGLQTCIADFLFAKKPDLNIVDAYRVITSNGPRGGNLETVAQVGSLIISPDIVAADTAAYMMAEQALGSRVRGPAEHVRIASQAGFGQMDLSKLNIARVAL